jgi:hypothetical protein
VSEEKRLVFRSEPGLDAYRGLVVVMMVVVHARRLQEAPTSDWANDSLRLFMWLEPYIAASFLFIAGYALVLSHSRARAGWLRKLLVRAGMLYLLSVALFVPQFGLEWPDLVFSSGILSAIAVAIALVGAALASRAADAALAGLTVAVLGVTALLDRTGASVSGLNAGPGGAFPLVAFTATGALLARARAHFGDRALTLSAWALVPVTLGVLLSRAPWLTERASYYSSHAGQLALVDLGSDAPKSAVRFWNHSAWGALGLFLPLVASTVASLRGGTWVGRVVAFDPLVVLGRHALGAYVVHLGLLGVADLMGLDPKSSLGTWGLVLGICLGLFALAYVLDRVRPRRVPVSEARGGA